MDADVLGRAMCEATDELDLQPDFIGRVVRGGQRRARRRRIGIVAAATAMLVVAGVGVVAALPGRETNQIAAPPAAPLDWRLEQPTMGNLAGDRQLLNDAVQAWKVGIARSYTAEGGIFDDLRGDPHIYWASTTPAGRTAVVMQQAFLHPSNRLPDTETNKWQTMIGLVAVDPIDGKLKLVGDQYQSEGGPAPGNFQFGPGDRTILVLDVGLPLYFSTAAETQSDGRINRSWQQMTVTDGIAVVQLPEGVDLTAVRVLARATRPTPYETSNDGLIRLQPASGYLTGVFMYNFADHHLPWPKTSGRATPTPRPGDDRVIRVGTNPTVPGDVINTLGTWLEERGFIDVGNWGSSPGLWSVAAGLPDGRTALVAEYQQGNDSSKLYAVLVDRAGKVQAIQYGGPVNLTAPLPVAIRLPDAQGWVVAAYGSHLRYRNAPGGQWLDGGNDAALLPDDAIQVQVTPNNAAPTEVTLTR